MPPQHGHEHLVAAFGLNNKHRRNDRHHHPEKALSPHTLANVIETDWRFGAQGVVIRPQQRVVVFATQPLRQSAAEEIGDIGHRRTPNNRLPVHHRQRAVGSGLAEKHVVKPIVAVHKTVRNAGLAKLR